MKYNFFFGTLLIVLLSASGYFFLNVYKSSKDNTENPPITIIKDSQFENAVSLIEAGKYQEADTILTSLETNISMNDLAYLRLKKLQILLSKKDYQAAIAALDTILVNPLFPKSTKARALENIFSSYFNSGKNEDFYNAIFMSPQLSSLRATSSQQSFFNYAEYGYSIWPNTVLGANAIYGRLDDIKLTKDPVVQEEKKKDLANFLINFFSNSDKEIILLSEYPHQEHSLIFTYLERARVLRHARDRAVLTPPQYKELDQLIPLMRLSKTIEDPFYKFYSVFLYIHYLYLSKITIPPELPKDIQGMVSDVSIFDTKIITKEWYTQVIGTTKKWTKERKDFLSNINPGLGNLIELYN